MNKLLIPVMGFMTETRALSVEILDATSADLKISCCSVELTSCPTIRPWFSACEIGISSRVDVL